MHDYNIFFTNWKFSRYPFRVTINHILTFDEQSTILVYKIVTANGSYSWGGDGDATILAASNVKRFRVI